MLRAAISKLAWVIVVALVVTAQARAQTEAGTVAAVVGTLQVQRAGTWQSASTGLPLFVGDRLRTGDADQAKIVFRDDTVLDLAPKTELSLDKQVFDPGAHRFHAQLQLLKGKIRAWVSEYYREPRARYEVETPTAIAGVRGTEFVALYDLTGEFTDVVGVAETVEVTGKLGVVGPGVQVGPRLYSRVQKGRFPTAPQRLDDAAFQQYLDGLEIIGTGRRDGLSVQHPAVAGRVLAAQDVPAPPRAPAARAAAEQIAVGAREDFLGVRMSPDARTNTQPLLGFRRTPPGRAPTAPTGSVSVGF